MKFLMKVFKTVLVMILLVNQSFAGTGEIAQAMTLSQRLSEIYSQTGENQNVFEMAQSAQASGITLNDATESTILAKADETLTRYGLSVNEIRQLVLDNRSMTKADLTAYLNKRLKSSNSENCVVCQIVLLVVGTVVACIVISIVTSGSSKKLNENIADSELAKACAKAIKEKNRSDIDLFCSKSN